MYGKRVHEAVLSAGERVTGVTVHVVDELYDHGRILAQCDVPVRERDTAEALAERVLREEHRLYPDTLRRIAAGEIVLD
jgi:phosphoribosylglycinamide formyltransferase-1